MREKTCCFTGHRLVPEWQRDHISVALRTTTRNLILSGYQYFGTGGALGFDTMAAQMILKLKADFSYIKLILVLPCKDVFVNEKVEQKGSKKLSTISTKEYKDIGRPEVFQRAQMHNIWSPFSAM